MKMINAVQFEYVPNKLQSHIKSIANINLMKLYKEKTLKETERINWLTSHLLTFEMSSIIAVTVQAKLVRP